MPKKSSIDEYEKLSLTDLQREIRDAQKDLAKVEIAVRMGTDKNSAHYKQKKKQIARMKTVETRKMKLLNNEKRTATLSAQSAA